MIYLVIIKYNSIISRLDQPKITVYHCLQTNKLHVLFRFNFYLRLKAILKPSFGLMIKSIIILMFSGASNDLI